MINNNIFKIMFISVIMLFCGFVLIFFNQYFSASAIKISDFLYFPWLVAEILIAFFIEFILIKSRKNINLWLFPCAFFLANLGLLIVGRLEYTLIIPQIRWIILGMIIFFITFRFEIWIRKLLNYKYFWGILYISLVLITIFFGRDINGISNSVALQNIRFQPLEFAKIILVFFLASYFGNLEQTADINEFKNSFFSFNNVQIFFLPLFIFAVSFLLFILANDFGNALIFFSLTLIIMYIKTENKILTIASIILFFTAMFVSYYILPEVKVFFDAWLNPWAVSNEFSQKILSSLFAFGEGKIWGAGFMMGHPDFIMEAHSNFIFSAIVEEFGLIGSVLLMMIYVLLFYQSVSVAFKLKNNTDILLAFGFGVLFFLQMFITLLSAVNLLPITKTFLPFIGYGGSAAIFNFIMLGILVSLSRKESFNG